MTDDKTRISTELDDHFVALHSGFLLGKYELQSVLGQGGFGITYKAWDSALNRAVAIKEYLPSDVAVRVGGSTVRAKSRNDQESFQWGLERFLEEARALARFEATPSIVRVYDYMQDNGTAYMVMALIEGTPLSAVYRREAPLSEERLKAIVLPVLDGLDDVHHAGFLHRDIKPANILIRPNGNPVLIDFGAARQALGEKSRSITSVFTPGYAPFEQYTSSGRQGAWTDIYALAATLYHGVTGKPPPQATDRIREDPMAPAVQAGAGRYSPQFLAAIDRGLEVFENRRPQNVAHWRDMLSGAVSLPVPGSFAPTAQAAPYQGAPPPSQPSRGQPTAVPTLGERGVPSQTPEFSQTGPASIAPERKSRAGVMAAAAVVVLLAGGAGAFFAFSPSDKTQIAADESVQQRAQRLADEARRAADQAREAQDAAEAEMKKRAELEAQQKAAEETRRQEDAELARKAEQARRDAERAQRENDGEAKRKAEEEARKIAEAEAGRRAEQERLERERKSLEADRAKAEAELIEARRQAVEARQQADQLRAQAEKTRLEAEAARKAADETRAKAEAEAKTKAEAEARRKAEADAKAKLDVEAKAKAKVEAEAKAKTDAAAAAKKKAEDEAKAKAAAVVAPPSPAAEKARTDAALAGLQPPAQPPVTSADVRAAPATQQAAAPAYAYAGRWTLVIDCPNVSAPPFINVQIFINGPSFSGNFFRDGKLTGEIAGTSLRMQFSFTGRSGDGFKGSASASARNDNEFRGGGIVSGFSAGANDRQCPVTLSR